MRIVGNLDVEVTWARMDATARRARGEKAPSPDDPRFALPEAVMRKISAAATLMRVAALDDEDELWTPRPVDPARMARVEWLPSPRLVSGPVPETADVWWGEPTEIAAVVNHRSCVEEFRRSVPRYWLPGAEIVRSLEELETHAGRTPRWVAKAPHSAAGRSRVRSDGPFIDPKARVQASRLLELHGCLLFEPWFNRVQDLGVAGRVFVEPVRLGSRPVLGRSRTEVAILPVHRLRVDPAGRFVGIAVGATAQQHADASTAGLSVGEVLGSLGFSGQFGVDLYRAPRADGSTHLHLSEINARHTFGHVAQALAPKARAHMGIGEAESLTLRFGRGAPPPDTIPLLLPGTDDDTSAWLEVPSRHGS